MPFTADLNPKGGKSTDLLDLIKMEDYLERKRALSPKAAVKTATPVADAILAKTNDMIKSSADDVGTQFRFNNNQR
jgi:5,10-methylenetetrahydrofolate reductase